ncbi:ABC transporter ATP-binding protein/permease [Paenibacillus doosanensis]|uniref:ABC transporter ATP-binding protein n=1 Tax=Paenibacillus doosanensis TaxID=1229154 RepID=UPI0021804540|nr:ABC transporter ATP-binding protein [Paenibacillus doosanensis]MCS7459578.1 ABC transporter ATP-binding protein/permease [Paenibacillus doosanensis]
MAESNRDTQSASSARPMSPPMGMGGPMGGGPGGPGRGMMAKVRPKNTRATLQRIWHYLRRQRAGLISVFILTVIGSGLALAGPYMIGLAIDKYIIPHDYGGLIRLCAALLAIYVLSAAMTWAQAYVMTGVSQRTVCELRADLFAKIQKLPLQFFDSRTHGELMSRTTNDIENVSNTLNQSVTQLISSVITVAGALLFMLKLNIWLTLLSLITIPLVMLVTGKISGYTRKHFSGQQKHLGEINGFIEETVSGQKVVKSFRREAKTIEQFNDINTKLRDVGTKAQIFSGMMGPVMNVLNNISFALIAAVGGWMVLNDMSTIGIIVSFLNYSKQFGRPINDLANQFNMIQSGVAGAERVFEIMDTKTEYEDATASRELRQVNGEVVLSGVSFGYKPDIPVLKNVSLTANPGDTIALVGPTGAGKTTIINLLTRFYDIQEGTITIDGQRIRDLDKDQLRRQLGIVLQDAYLFADTIRENIRYGRLDATNEQIEDAARLANADSFIRKLPQGYDTVLSAEGSNLSQGQRQLITIARAILADPAILILDEATSSVDTRTEMHIQEAMNSLMKGRTSFVIAHRLSTIREADQILVINGGEIIERGTHQQLLDSQGFYYELYNSQFKRVG